MQHEIKEKGRLLSKDGSLREPGFARSLLLEYSREDIKSPRFLIKEWDYYLIHNDDFGIALTVADNGYMSLISASFLDFKEPFSRTESPISLFSMGSLNLPRSSAFGVTQGKNKSSTLRFEVKDGLRRLYCHMDKFKDGMPLKAEITLGDEPQDSMVIATPFENRKRAFYYNQKIIGMKAQGKLSFGGNEYVFSPENSFGLLDWGRGVWTYKNTWYWGAAQGLIDGEPFGFNLGYGFGDTSAASENMIFYKGRAHKLDRINFDIPIKNGTDCFLSNWKVSDNEGRLNLDFVPIMDRAAKTDFLVLCSDQHQVFGKFSGWAVLDDGTKIQIKNLLGFAEKVYNKW